MTYEEAEGLAATVRQVTGHQAVVRFDADDGVFVVAVPIHTPRCEEVMHAEFLLEDELDWEELRDRITNA